MSWRRAVILALTIASCAAVPKAGSKRELQRLVRLPQIDFPTPLNFDRTSGFTVFPLIGSAASEVAQLLKEAKGVPGDAPLFLQAARWFASGGDTANSIRSYARAADLFGRRTQADPGHAAGWVGLAEAFAALGRFGEAQTSLNRAAAADADSPALQLALVEFHKEKAWSAFAGEENRFGSNGFLEVLDTIVKRGDGAVIEAAQKELRSAQRHLDLAGTTLETKPEFLRARAVFLSFREGLEAAFTQIHEGTRLPRELRRSLYLASAVDDLCRAAESEDADPSLIASAIFASGVADAKSEDPYGIWVQLSEEGRSRLSRLSQQLATLADSRTKAAAEAAEYLGCVQLYLMKDFSGAGRNFRAALRAEPLRERSWELVVYSIFAEGDFRTLVETCEERSATLPNARSSALLIHSYDRQGESTKAEWTALTASTAYPHDFQVSLSLAAVLLKRENLAAVLWRAGDALNKAEKQLGPGPTRDAQLAFVLMKSIYLALSDQPEQAKALLAPYATPGRIRPEVQEVLTLLD